MIEIKISEELKKICPEMKLGCIEAQVNVQSSGEGLWKEINYYCEVLNKEINIENLASLSRIKDGRETYKKLGKVPSKYRLSSEALLRRILQGKGMYKVNNIVDINNLMSIKSKFPVGSYNIKNLHSPINLVIGKEGEQYKGIGKENINIANLPVLADSLGSFGSPTSDSERAMITDNVSEILMCIFCFSGKTNMEEYLEYGKELLERYANGKDIKIKVIE
ncbi:B3/B4 domain-containing protein [Clostridium sp. 'White wine YQ']|uniref:B3/B4 domain-containing protein n=1 Tax=Clostridium sp. 'White wine YQ' TaxID=3027474 RepID=UPI002366A3CD|nr:phenylalanine--tRNA ligase beta subunit-related protein [Clostridium sp. 'White wine YQ']MDD7794385.1 phenylalanine--tRNA ligase beta subunit-related protein [Clostridium sp. 'White wine YQ']